MKPLLRLTLLLSLLVAAACGPAATAVPPSSAPTALPAATVVPSTPVPTQAPPTAEPTPDLLATIQTFQDTFNQQDTEGALALFVADPHWTLLLGPLTGYATLTSTLALRNTLEFQFELNTQLEATGCTVKSDQATCVVVIKDDCTPPAIVAYHFHTQITFTDDKIANVFGRWDSSDESAFLAYDAARQAWARENLPDDAAAYNSTSFGGEGLSDLGEWGKFIGIGELGTGKLTAVEFGQSVERVCAGYTATVQ